MIVIIILLFIAIAVGVACVVTTVQFMDMFDLLVALGGFAIALISAGVLGYLLGKP